MKRKPIPYSKRPSYKHLSDKALWNRGLTGFGQRLVKHIVGVAIAPIFARFERSDYWVAGFAKVLCCVGVRRRIAAADVPACLTQTQMQPASAGFQAVFATVGTWVYRLNFAYMLAVFHLQPP